MKKLKHEQDKSKTLKHKKGKPLPFLVAVVLNHGGRRSWRWRLVAIGGEEFRSEAWLKKDEEDNEEERWRSGAAHKSTVKPLF